MSMKKVLLLTLVLVLAFSSLAFAAPSEAEVIDSFKEYARTEVDKTLATYEAKNQQIFEFNKGKPPEEEAEKCTSPKHEGTECYIFILAYQDEKWVVTNVVLKYSGEVKSMGIYDKLKNKYW